MTTWAQITEEIKIEKETTEKIKGLVKVWDKQDLCYHAKRIVDTLKYLFEQEEKDIEKLSKRAERINEA